MTHIKQKGFTIVELLIVIVVIGILAAIVIVAFNGVQNRANDTAVQSDLKNFSNTMESTKATDTLSLYPTSGNIAATGAKFSKSAYLQGVNNLLYCRAGGGSGYLLVIRSKSSKLYYVGSATGVKEYTAVWNGSGADLCTELLPGSSGTWGLQTGWAEFI